MTLRAQLEERNQWMSDAVDILSGARDFITANTEESKP